MGSEQVDRIQGVVAVVRTLGEGNWGSLEAAGGVHPLKESPGGSLLPGIREGEEEDCLEGSQAVVEEAEYWMVEEVVIQGEP